MHSDTIRSPACVQCFGTTSLHTVIYALVFSCAKLDLRQIHTTLKGERGGGGGGSVKQTESTEIVRARKEGGGGHQPVPSLSIPCKKYYSHSLP